MKTATVIARHNALLVALACVACRGVSAGASETAKLPDPDLPDTTARPTVDVDLSHSGIGATIRGPQGAKAVASGDHVTVDAEPDFHMQVHRGTLDVLAEKAEIVRAWGPGFRRFVRDDDTSVIYETEVAGDNRFHFFSWGDVEGLLYHCRSDERGADSLDAVQAMLAGCHAITVHEHIAGQP